jgi:hypothetical protein
MFNNQLSVQDWLSLSIEVRDKFVQIFNIPRSSGTIVDGNIVKSDGHSQQDLTVINIENLKNYLQEAEINDFEVLFQLALDKINNELKPAEPEYVPLDPATLLVEEWVATLGRMKQRAKEANMEMLLQEAIKQIFNEDDIWQKQSYEKTVKVRGRKTKNNRS